MKDLVFISLAFGQAYLDQQTRLKQSILDLIPDANIEFWYGTMPPGARSMNDSLYGFKPHCVDEARLAGYKRVIWLDPAMILVDPNLYDLLRYPFAAVRDDHKLSPFISSEALAWSQLTRTDIAAVHLVGGSLYYFDFNDHAANNILDFWLRSEQGNMFDGAGQRHTGAERGHRSDEALMAVAMFRNGVRPITHADVRYCIDNNPMFIKKHFK